MIPDREACLRLLSDAGCSAAVVDHVQAVARLASRMATLASSADAAIVEAGALLHDIGRSIEHGVDHVPAGVELLQQAGVDERVVACVARHMGAGIGPEQAQAWGWPDGRGYVPERIEEKIVSHADNLTFGTAYGGLQRVVAKWDGQGLSEEIPQVRVLHVELRDALGVDPDELVGSMQPGGTGRDG